MMTHTLCGARPLYDDDGNRDHFPQRGSVPDRLRVVTPSAQRPVGGPVEDQHQGPDRGLPAMFGAFAGISALVALLVIGGTGVGYLLDEVFSASPVFVFAGLALGIAAAVLAVRSIVTRYLGS